MAMKKKTTKKQSKIALKIDKLQVLGEQCLKDIESIKSERKDKQGDHSFKKIHK